MISAIRETIHQSSCTFQSYGLLSRRELLHSLDLVRAGFELLYEYSANTWGRNSDVLGHFFVRSSVDASKFGVTFLTFSGDVTVTGRPLRGRSWKEPVSFYLATVRYINFSFNLRDFRAVKIGCLRFPERRSPMAAARFTSIRNKRYNRQDKHTNTNLHEKEDSI